MVAIAVLGAAVLAAGTSSPPAAAPVDAAPAHGHIEFLWEARDPAGAARPVALGLLLRPERPHQLCWKSANFPARRVVVRLDAEDGRGREIPLVEETVQGLGTRPVRCHPLEPARQGLAAGAYDVVLRYDGVEVARQRIEVAASLAEAGFHRRDAIYVQGRTNYPEDVAPEDYRGHFLWKLTFDAGGRVIAVETLEVDGIAASLREAGDQAARMYRIGAAPAGQGNATASFLLRYDLVP